MHDEIHLIHGKIITEVVREEISDYLFHVYL